MKNSLNALRHNLLAAPRKIFLVDGAGALISALMLGAVLAPLHPFTGLPSTTLYLLSAVAVVFAAYSFTCYFRIKDQWRPYLLVIAVANILYGLFTAGLLIRFSSSLTMPGMIYFIGELLVIGSLVCLEISLIVKKK